MPTPTLYSQIYTMDITLDLYTCVLNDMHNIIVDLVSCRALHAGCIYIYIYIYIYNNNTRNFYSTFIEIIIIVIIL